MFDVPFNGKYHEFPLQGVVANSFYYTGLMELHLAMDADSCFFQFSGPLEFIRDGQTEVVERLTQRYVEVAYSVLWKPIRLARANEYGLLELDFGSAGCLRVPDGPYENWEFTHIHYGTPMRSFRMTGGVGMTSVWRH